MDEENFERFMYFENHEKVLAESVDNFLSCQAFVDMTLVCDGGKKIKVHRAVLAACSPLFENILIDIDDQSHPVLIFNDISEDLMVSIVKFIYKGKTGISPAFTDLFLSVAKKLQIRGLENQGINLQENFPQLSVYPVKETMAGSKRKQQSLTDRNPARNSKFDGYQQVQQLSEKPEKLSLTIKSGSGTKVINPFALKRIQRESESTSTEDDIYVPGPSKFDTKIEADSSKTGNIQEDDSDIEFIEDNANSSIVVINESQNSVPAKWLPTEHTNNKRPIVSTRPTSDVEDDSDDSEVWTSHRKKKKNSNNVKSDAEESNKSNKDENKPEKNSRETSESPVLITPVETEDVPKAMVETVKQETPNTFSETEYLQNTFQALGRYCVICKVFKKNIGLHVKRLHNVPIRRPTYTCKTCSKTFYMQHTLQVHKCIS